MAVINNKEYYIIEEVSPQEIEDKAHKKKSSRIMQRKYERPITERKPFMFNGIPTY